jgi:hypothetical protein
VVDTDFNKHFMDGRNSTSSLKGFDLAYTAPFRILSDRGVQEFRSVLDENKDHIKPLIRSTTLRGLGYRSQWVRDFSLSPELLNILGDVTSDSLQPNPHTMNIAHTNFSQVGGKAGESWHLDSVDYVLIIILSDCEAMVGGELEVLKSPIDGAEADATHTMLDNGEFPDSLIERLNYPAPGYAILMQGSKFYHTVTPVTGGVEPRIACVNSYNKANVFATDTGRYRSYTDTFLDDKRVVDVEYSRAKASRIQGQLEYMLQQTHFDTGAALKDGEDMAVLLENAGRELLQAAEIIRGADDSMQCNRASK